MPHYRRSRNPGGTFFFTVALADRESSALVERIDRFRATYAAVQTELRFRTVALCVLPDHLHALWELPADDPDFSNRWSRIKSGFSRALPPGARSASKLGKREKGVWQRRFWEHRIRDESDLQNHFDYIHFNPVKHRLVRRVADWPYSSFHRYVKAGVLILDWGGVVNSVEVGGEPE